jgi:hypothetical protein
MAVAWREEVSLRQERQWHRAWLVSRLVACGVMSCTHRQSWLAIERVGGFAAEAASFGLHFVFSFLRWFQEDLLGNDRIVRLEFAIPATNVTLTKRLFSSFIFSSECHTCSAQHWQQAIVA